MLPPCNPHAWGQHGLVQGLQLSGVPCLPLIRKGIKAEADCPQWCCGICHMGCLFWGHSRAGCLKIERGKAKRDRFCEVCYYCSELPVLPCTKVQITWHACIVYSLTDLFVLARQKTEYPTLSPMSDSTITRGGIHGHRYPFLYLCYEYTLYK